jgi:hypothetical protein
MAPRSGSTVEDVKRAKIKEKTKSQDRYLGIRSNGNETNKKFYFKPIVTKTSETVHLSLTKMVTT